MLRLGTNLASHRKQSGPSECTTVASDRTGGGVPAMTRALYSGSATQLNGRRRNVSELGAHAEASAHTVGVAVVSKPSSR